MPIRDVRAVTPAVLMPCLSLVSALVDNGLSNGVVQGWKLKEAWVEAMAKHKQLIGSYRNKDLPEDLKIHFSTMFKTLRDFAKEEGSWTGEKRYPKTGP